MIQLVNEWKYRDRAIYLDISLIVLGVTLFSLYWYDTRMFGLTLLGLGFERRD